MGSLECPSVRAAPLVGRSLVIARLCSYKGMFFLARSYDEGNVFVGLLPVYEAEGYRETSTNSFQAALVSKCLKFDAYFQMLSGSWLRVYNCA